MERQQLELTFAGEVHFRPLWRGERRISRARWWFEQMYRAVEKAPDWQPQPQGRPLEAQLPAAQGRS
jgi:hypothetical protein